jgi:hypothetical protein
MGAPGAAGGSCCSCCCCCCCWETYALPHLLSWLALKAYVWLNDEGHTGCPHTLSQLLELRHTQRCTKVRHGHGIAVNLVAGSVCSSSNSSSSSSSSSSDQLHYQIVSGLAAPKCGTGTGSPSTWLQAASAATTAVAAVASHTTSLLLDAPSGARARDRRSSGCRQRLQQWPAVRSQAG